MGWKRDIMERVVGTCARFAPRLDAAPAEPRSVFVLRNNGIGDLLLTTPMLAALRRRYPRSRIVVGAGSWVADVLDGNPNVDEVMPVNAPWGNHLVLPTTPLSPVAYMFSGEAAAIARERFEIGIDVCGSVSGALLLMRAGIPWRLGVRGYAGGHSAMQQWTEHREEEQVAVAGLRFAELLGATDLPEPRPQIFLEKPPKKHGAILFSPGGGFREKCWPLENFVELAKLLAPRRILVIGDRADKPLGARLADAGAHVEDQTGTSGLRETFAAIAGSPLVICNSSMAMHAAAAFRIPCVTLLGDIFPSAAAHARLWGHPETVILGRELEAPEIATPEQVLDALRSRDLLP